jgi:L-malate glycosyltransferase
MSRNRDPKPLVLRFVSRMAIGGVQNSILETLACADRRRFRFAVLCYKKAGDWAPRLKELGVPLHVQKALPVWDPYQIWRLSNVIRALDPDLIHIYMAPSVIVGATAARLAGVRRVVIHHNSLYRDRHWAKQNEFLNRWERALTRRADAVIAVSQTVADCTRDWLGDAPRPIRVIPDGINVERFANPVPVDLRAELGLPPGRPIVGLVARFLEVKRIEDFIDAAGLIGRTWGERTGPPPVFLVVGGGPDQLGNPLKARAAALAADADIRFLGGRNDLPSLLPDFDVGVLCSEVEGCPNTILEYMAAGVPIAATAIPSIAELAAHERHALLSPPRNPDALAASVLRLLDDRPLAARLVADARAHVTRYSSDRAEAAYEAVYDEVLGRTPKRI